MLLLSWVAFVAARFAASIGFMLLDMIHDNVGSGCNTTKVLDSFQITKTEVAAETKRKRGESNLDDHDLEYSILQF